MAAKPIILGQKITPYITSSLYLLGLPRIIREKTIKDLKIDIDKLEGFDFIKISSKAIEVQEALEGVSELGIAIRTNNKEYTKEIIKAIPNRPKRDKITGESIRIKGESKELKRKTIGSNLVRIIPTL